MNNVVIRMQHSLKAALCIMACAMLCLACSESEDEEQQEFAGWQKKNEAFFASLADSLAANPQQWRRVAAYSKDEDIAKDSEHIYIKVMESGNGTESPLFNDSVRVSYRGRLIPSRTYTEGYVFDETVYGNYSNATNGSRKFLVSSLVDGWVTALMLMHRGDYWRIYVPSDLGYGDADNSSSGIPGHSVLVFDLTLLDFSHVGNAMGPWSVRQR